MSRLRQAAEMALECLDYHWDNPDSDLEHWPHVLETKQALRQALAQPEREWVGIHEDELRVLAYNDPSGERLKLAKAVEAKLKQKNEPA